MLAAVATSEEEISDKALACVTPLPLPGDCDGRGDDGIAAIDRWVAAAAASDAAISTSCFVAATSSRAAAVGLNLSTSLSVRTLLLSLFRNSSPAKTRFRSFSDLATALPLSVSVLGVELNTESFCDRDNRGGGGGGAARVLDTMLLISELLDGTAAATIEAAKQNQTTKRGYTVCLRVRHIAGRGELNCDQGVAQSAMVKPGKVTATSSEAKNSKVEENVIHAVRPATDALSTLTLSGRKGSGCLSHWCLPRQDCAHIGLGQ